MKAYASELVYKVTDYFLSYAMNGSNYAQSRGSEQREVKKDRKRRKEQLPAKGGKGRLK